MHVEVLSGLLIPFWGTSLGAAWVFSIRKAPSQKMEQGLLGFSAGVMVAASVWSLILPALERWESLGKIRFLPAVAGFWGGVLFLFLLDRLISCLVERFQREFRDKTLMILAVTLHNIPEGMAVGAAYGGLLLGNGAVSAAGALALSMGIAAQNFPEGAILSLPLHAGGMKKRRAFFIGVLSGAVEPVAAVLTMLAMEFALPALPFLLCFAAGTMVYVAVAEVIPQMIRDNSANPGAVFFAVGFTIMMALDVALG